MLCLRATAGRFPDTYQDKSVPTKVGEEPGKLLENMRTTNISKVSNFYSSGKAQRGDDQCATCTARFRTVTGSLTWAADTVKPRLTQAMEGGRATEQIARSEAGRRLIILTMELRNSRTLSGLLLKIVNIFAYEIFATFTICVHVLQ